jgi:hypothetical protein
LGTSLAAFISGYRGGSSMRLPLLVCGHPTHPVMYAEGQITNINGGAVNQEFEQFPVDERSYFFPVSDIIGFPTVLYPPIGFHCFDAIQWLKSGINAFLSPLASINIEATSDQRLKFTLLTGTRVDLRFDVGSGSHAWYRHQMGLPVGPFSISPTWISPDFIKGRLEPRFGTTEDIVKVVGNASQYAPEIGPPQTLWASNWHEISISIRLDGFPRVPSGYSEYDLGVAFVKLAQTGCPIWFFPDKTVKTKYSPTNRYGFHQVRPIIDSISLSPERGDWMRYWKLAFRATIEDV